MKMLISNEELKLLKSRDLVPLECENCKEIFCKGKNNVLSSLKGHPDFPLRFCSMKCYFTFQKNSNWTNKKWEECKIEVLKQKSKILKNKYNFCSKSCSAKFQNRNKTLGKSNKSKAESYFSNLIRNDFENLSVNENVRNILPSGLEIDVYIPQIHLAIEINGPLHFLPIHGVEKLSKIQNKDAQKKTEAVEVRCELLVIDISRIKYWKETKEFLDDEYHQKIKPFIETKLKTYST